MITTTGRVDTTEESGIRYFVRWNYRRLQPKIPFLVCFGDEVGAVSVSFLTDAGGFVVAAPEDHDWRGISQRILKRDEVVGSPLAAAAFRVIDEIWLHDPELGLWVGGNNVARIDDSCGFSEEILIQSALEADGDQESLPPQAAGICRWMDGLRSRFRGGPSVG